MASRRPYGPYRAVIDPGDDCCSGPGYQTRVHQFFGGSPSRTAPTSPATGSPTWTTCAVITPDQFITVINPNTTGAVLDKVLGTIDLAGEHDLFIISDD